MKHTHVTYWQVKACATTFPRIIHVPQANTTFKVKPIASKSYCIILCIYYVYMWYFLILYLNVFNKFGNIPPPPKG